MAKAKVVVTATDNLAKGLGQSKKQLTDFEKYIQGIGKKLNTAFNITAIATAAVASFKAMSSAAKACIQEYTEAERVSKRLEAVWANVGAATGKTAKQIDDYAEAIEKTTYFSAESVKEAGLLLAATESLTQDGFQRALDVSVDLAAALGEDVTSAAQTLAKAIQEPESALSRLKTIGVSFTEDEKDQIKALTDANQTYEAQALILDKIEAKYKDVAKAINETPAGKLDNIRDVLSDIRKTLGETLLNSISPALDTLYNSLIRISNWIAMMAKSTGVISALQAGESLTNFSAAELELGLKAVNDALKSNRNEMKAHETSYLRFRTTLEQEIAYRKSLADMTIPAYETGSNVVTPTSSPTQSPLAAFLSSYGKSSAEYQKAALIEAINQALSYRNEFRTTNFLGNRVWSQAAMEKYGLDLAGIQAADTYLGEIIIALERQLNPRTSNPSVSVKNPMANFDPSMGGLFTNDHTNYRGQAFNDKLTGTLTGSLGKFGNVVEKATENLQNMGPVLGSIMTVLEPIIQGLGEVLTPMLDTITDIVLKPLVEVGRMIGSLILPVLDVLAPVLQIVGTAVVGVAATFEWVGQLLRHWAASFVNAFSWITGYSMTDPGSPGNIFDYISGRVSAYQNSTSGADSVSTGTAVSSASYRGATSVTINVYTSAVVGEGGMREFARMIKDEFDALDYYGVSA